MASGGLEPRRVFGEPDPENAFSEMFCSENAGLGWPDHESAGLRVYAV